MSFESTNQINSNNSNSEENNSNNTSSNNNTNVNRDRKTNSNGKLSDLEFVKLWRSSKSRTEMVEKTGFSINTVLNWMNRINHAIKAAGGKELAILPLTEFGRRKQSGNIDDILALIEENKGNEENEENGNSNNSESNTTEIAT